MASLSHIKQLPDYDEPVATPYEQARQAFLDARLIPPVDIKMDGQIHRFSVSDKAGDDAGWYVLYGDNVPSGVIGNWRTGETYNFRAQMSRPLTAIEEMQIRQRQEEARAKRSEELTKKHERAAATVAEIWESAIPASADHGYLLRKGIQPHGARIGGDGRLIVPLHDSDGRLSSIQYIDAAGNKIYHPGGEVKGMHYQMGDVVGNETIYVAEGFATAATICEVMHGPTIAAYSANNLEPVVGKIRAQWPTAEIVIVADNDNNELKPGVYYPNPEMHQHPGLYYANQAAAKHGARVVLIPNEGQDANDYHAAGGDLHSLLAPETSSWFDCDTDLMKQPSPIKWIIRRWLQESVVIVVHGPSTVGKSFQVVDWGLSIAYKKDWNGCKINGGVVAYCAGEGHHGLRARMAAWRQVNEITETGRFFMSKTSKPLDTPAGLQSIISELRRLPERPKLVIIDTLSKFIVELDENSNKDINFLISQAEIIRNEFDTSVLIVHHTGHGPENQSRGRGGSALRSGVENEISIRFEGENRIIEQVKIKDDEKLPPIYFNLKSIDIEGWFDDEGEQVRSAVVEYIDSSKVPNKKPTAEIDLVEKMWNFAGREFFEDCPFLTYSAMKRYLTTVEKMSEGGAKSKLLKTADKDTFLKRAINSGILFECEGGYKVCDEDLIERFCIRFSKVD